MIAKLTLIEIEWPDAFAQLQDDPRLLERWTTQAFGQSEVDWNPDGDILHTGENGVANETVNRRAKTKARKAFGDFLRLSATTDSEHLRAMLSLKQSQVELELPGCTELREAIVNGDRGLVAEILEETDEEIRGDLAGRIPNFLRSELSAGYLDSARVIVDVVASVRAFFPLNEVRREVIFIAVEDPDLRAQLPTLDAETVLGQSQLLPLSSRQKLFEPFLEQLLDGSLANHLRQPPAEALGPYAGDLSASQASRVLEAISGEMKSNFDLYLPLVRAEPKLLPAAAAEFAAAALAEPRGAEPALGEPMPLSEKPRPLEVVELGLRDPSVNLMEIILSLIPRIIRAHAGQESVLTAELPIYLRLLKPLEIAREELWSEVARAIESGWGQMPVGLWPLSLRLVDLAAERTDEETRTIVSGTITEGIFADPDQGLALTGESGMPPGCFEQPFVSRLTTLSGQPAHWQAACEALKRIDSEAFPQWLANAFHNLLSAGNLDEARAMLEVHGAVFETDHAPLANAATPVLVERAGADQAMPADLLATLSEITNDEQLDELATAYVGSLSGPRGSAIPDLLDELRMHNAMRLRLSIAHKAIARMGEDSESTPAPQIAVACRQVDQLPAEDQRLLAAGLAVRLRTRLDQALEIAGNVSTIRGISAKPSKELVEALIDAESAIPEEGTRRQLLSAANTIRGRPKSLATSALRQRLDTLSQSERAFDRELAGQFLALLDG